MANPPSFQNGLDILNLCRYYKLDKNNNPVTVDGVLEWGKFFQSHNRLLFIDLFPTHKKSNDIVTSVFLGIPHEGGLFETMSGDNQYRAETYDRIMVIHQKAVEMRLWTILKKVGEPKEFISPSTMDILESLYFKYYKLPSFTPVGNSVKIGDNYLGGFGDLIYRRRLVPSSTAPSGYELIYRENRIVEWWDISNPSFDPSILVTETPLNIKPYCIKGEIQFPCEEIGKHEDLFPK